MSAASRMLSHIRCEAPRYFRLMEEEDAEVEGIAHVLRDQGLRNVDCRAGHDHDAVCAVGASTRGAAAGE
jgi:hypothetical protein